MRVASWAAVLLAAAAAWPAQAGTLEQTIEAIQSAMEGGDRAGASRLLAEALRTHPQEAGLINLRGVLHAQQSEFAEARADFQTAVRLAPGLTPAWRNLGRACQLMSGEASAMGCAAAAWERVLRAEADDAEALRSLAAVYEWQGKFAESLRLMDRLPAEESGLPGVLALRCGDQAGLQRKTEAAQTCAALARGDFSEEDVFAILPVLESTRSAEIVITLLEPLEARGHASAAAEAKLAAAYEQAGHPAEARRLLERIAAQDAKNPEPLLQLARLAHAGHDLEGCLAYLGHARDLAPGDSRIHFQFGLVALEMNLPVEARRSVEKALSIDPENSEYNYTLGGILLSGGQAAASIPYFTKYVEARPNDARGHFARGAAYFDAMDYERCRAEMRAIRKDPKTEAGAAYFLGRIARMEENWEEAAAELQRAIVLAPSFAEAQTEMARVRMAQGQMAEARAAVERALALDPENFQANSTLLSILQMNHDPAATRQAEHLRTLDADRSRRRELMMRTIEVRPY